MAAIQNPPIFDEATPPADGQCLVYQASTNTWVPHTVTSAAVTVPQTHIAAAGAPAAVTSAHGSAPAAVTSVQEATVDAAAQGVGYVQADVQTIATLVNSLKVKYNAAQVDVAALRGELAALVTAYNLAQDDVVALRAEVATLTTKDATLLTELQTAGILSAS